MGSLACALAQVCPIDDTRTSLADSLAKTMIQLIIFRAIQGLGGGGILTLAMIISEYN